MRVLEDVLRLSMESKLSVLAVARCFQLAHCTVNDYLRRTVKAGQTWALTAGLADAELSAFLRIWTTPDAPDTTPSNR